jgi:MinD-like ATPase involved in chromosome partitioning or flagellar assembly
MEEAESTGIYFPNEEGGLNLGDYIYYLFSEREQQIASYGEAFLLRDQLGLEAFRPGKGINELGQLSKDRLERFFESLTKHSRIWCLLVDFPLNSSPSTEFLIKICSEIVLIDTGEPSSIHRNHKLVRHLEKQGLGGLDERLIHVRNKWLPQSDDQLPVYDIYVEFDPESFCVLDEHINLRNDRSFGIGVMNLAEQIGRTL